MRYKYIISLGFFCGVAQELERYGFRDYSLPFDWVISDLKTVNQLISNNFKHLFDIENLEKHPEYPYLVQHKDYKFDFYHDFKPEMTIKKQLTSVKEKYSRRISRFNRLVNSNEPILFVKYLHDLDTVTDIDHFIELLKAKNPNFKLLIIKHDYHCLDEIKNIDYIDYIYTVTITPGDSVNRRFIDSAPEVKKYFKAISFNDAKRTGNLLRYRVKWFQSKVRVLPGKIKKQLC